MSIESNVKLITYQLIIICGLLGLIAGGMFAR